MMDKLEEAMFKAIAAVTKFSILAKERSQDSVDHVSIKALADDANSSIVAIGEFVE